MTLAHFQEFNPHHVPAGSPAGGQFASASGGVSYRPSAKIRRQAQDYVASQGRAYTPLAPLRELDPERMKQVATAYDTMVHAPDDPAVKAAYQALASETIAQYHVLVDNGLKAEPAPAEGEPYHGAADMARDVRTNKHMYYYPTTRGFGSSTFDASDNPLLADSGLKDAKGNAMVVNDVFRVVHDYFGHVKDGNTFRPLGEENAWRSHMAMYSPLAAQAMTSEARGQNAWVYFGPHGATNRTATHGAAIHFADQKTGIMEAQALREARDQSQQRRIPGGILHPQHWEPPAADETKKGKGTVHMEMSRVQLHEAETQAILRRLRASGRTLRKKKRPPVASATTQALREAGFSEHDIAILQEGHQHEIEAAALWGGSGHLQRPTLDAAKERALDVLQEDVADGRAETNAADPIRMAATSGWVTEGAGTYTHPKAPGHKLMVSGQDWRHHLPNGQIAKRGTGAKALGEYAQTIGMENREALDRVLDRIRYGTREPGQAAAMALAESRLAGRVVEHGSVAAHEVVARLRGERGPLEAHKLVEAIRTRTGQSTSSGDLHERLRKAATR